MSLILNIETATEVCSVALGKAGEVLSLEEAGEANDHARIITGLVDRCLKTAGFELRDLSAVAVSTGPGSYTSLRVGASTAKGICYALDLPLIKADTLQALAAATLAACREQKALYCPMIDARRMEVYCALFDAENKSVMQTEARVVGETSFQEYFTSGKTLIFSGNGAAKCREVLKNKRAVFSDVVCSASHLVALSQDAFVKAQFVDPAYFVPYYQKPPNITKPKPKFSFLK
ncbi:MAG: tRNA (adenosine(37)-N6)-threonylcarbamoyltransferase complex dimerization subunit type 1 TsaB [Saprospiraceae bacterium]